MAVPYLPYFKLKEEPFNTTANPRFFFLSPIHSIALGKTEFTVDAKKGLTIVFGDTGTGKSTLARLLHQKFLDKGYTSVLLTNPNYPTTNSLLRTIIQEFQLPKTLKSYKDNLDIFKMFLYAEAVEKKKNIAAPVCCCVSSLRGRTEDAACEHNAERRQCYPDHRRSIRH